MWHHTAENRLDDTALREGFCMGTFLAQLFIAERFELLRGHAVCAAKHNQGLVLCPLNTCSGYLARSTICTLYHPFHCIETQIYVGFCIYVHSD